MTTPVNESNPQPDWVTTAPISTPPKKSHKLAWILGGIAFVLLLCLGGGLTVAALTSTNHPAKVVATLPPAGSSPNTEDGTPAATEPARTTHAGLTKADIKLTLTTKSKQCYGEAGCNVDLKVIAAVDSSKLGDDSWDVTYSIKGDETGPTIGTLTIGPDRSYEPDELMITTKSTHTKISVVVTQVEKV